MNGIGYGLIWNNHGVAVEWDQGRGKKGNSSLGIAPQRGNVVMFLLQSRTVKLQDMNDFTMLRNLIQVSHQ